MAIGDSGRVVLEIDPTLKRRLYVALAKDQRTLKAWFVHLAEGYIDSQVQPELFPRQEPDQSK